MSDRKNSISCCSQYHPLIKRPKYQHFIAFSFLCRQILWDNPFNPTRTTAVYLFKLELWVIGNYVLLWLYRLNCEAKQITLQRKSVRFLKEVEDIFVVSGKSSVNFVKMVSNHKILFFVRHCFSHWVLQLNVWTSIVVCAVISVLICKFMSHFC